MSLCDYHYVILSGSQVSSHGAEDRSLCHCVTMSQVDNVTMSLCSLRHYVILSGHELPCPLQPLVKRALEAGMREVGASLLPRGHVMAQYRRAHTSRTRIPAALPASLLYLLRSAPCGRSPPPLSFLLSCSCPPSFPPPSSSCSLNPLSLPSSPFPSPLPSLLSLPEQPSPPTKPPAYSLGSFVEASARGSRAPEAFRGLFSAQETHLRNCTRRALRCSSAGFPLSPQASWLALGSLPGSLPPSWFSPALPVSSAVSRAGQGRAFSL